MMAQQSQHDLRLVAEPDESVVTALLVAAKERAGEARVLQRAALEPLVAILQEAAVGRLPRSAWAERVGASLPETEGPAEITAG